MCDAARLCNGPAFEILDVSRTGLRFAYLRKKSIVLSRSQSYKANFQQHLKDLNSMTDHPLPQCPPYGFWMVLGSQTSERCCFRSPLIFQCNIHQEFLGVRQFFSFLPTRHRPKSMTKGLWNVKSKGPGNTISTQKTPAHKIPKFVLYT